MRTMPWTCLCLSTKRKGKIIVKIQGKNRLPLRAEVLIVVPTLFSQRIVCKLYVPKGR